MTKRKQDAIPERIREQADQIVATFNKRIIKDPECFYVTRYRGAYLYLDRRNHGPVGPIGRLKYQGTLHNWDFAIYKYSRERYDPAEWFFPGVEQLDGTIEGALKAGLEAYPLSDYEGIGLLQDWLALLLGEEHPS